jgi:hypothetical protein
MMRIHHFTPYLVLLLILAACLPAQPVVPTSQLSGALTQVETEVTQDPVTSTSPLVSATPLPTRTPRPTITPIPTDTLTPTPIPTVTPDPAVFNPAVFGDIRLLDSFVVTSIQKKTGKDYLYDYQTKSEYDRSLAGFHINTKFDGSDYSSWDDSYWMGDWQYRKDNQTGLWSVLKVDAKNNFNGFPLDSLDLGKITSIYYFKSAKYLGIEDYQGIPAYHYTFDQTNLIELQNIKIDKAQGELFVSVEGRYPLHSYARFTGKIIPDNSVDPPWGEGVNEITQDLVSYNQPVEISLPADYPNFDQNLDIPLPSGSTLASFSELAKGVKNYTYITLVNQEEFNAFYTALTPTNGWSAAKFVDLNGPSLYCTGCVSLSKGKQQVVLSFSERHLDFKIKDYVIGVTFITP